MPCVGLLAVVWLGEEGWKCMALYLVLEAWFKEGRKEGIWWLCMYNYRGSPVLPSRLGKKSYVLYMTFPLIVISTSCIEVSLLHPIHFHATVFSLVWFGTVLAPSVPSLTCLIATPIQDLLFRAQTGHACK